MSKVYFSDMRVTGRDSLPEKLRKLMYAAGVKDLPVNDRFVAIKLHFGEPGNIAYLRPNYAKVVVDVMRELGGRPFLTDCNTLYPGRRKNALEHLASAYENGFNPFTVGCHLIIADGLKGTDETLVPIDGELVKEAKIGHALMDADVIVSLTHFKMHEATGIGGALKNIGMGGGSRAGKHEMHASSNPEVDRDVCVGCGICKRNCAHNAIDMVDGKAMISRERCMGCGRCIGECPIDAVYAGTDDANDLVCKKIAEYTLAILKDKPHFHISLVIDVSPVCDCYSRNDAPVVPNIGMFASFDPVALDMACADAVNAAEPMPNSALSDVHGACADHFKAVHPDTDWFVCLEHAKKLGLGDTEYELIKV